MARFFPVRNIWKLMLDIRPTRAATSSITGFKRRIKVDFCRDVNYKETTLPILVVKASLSYQERLKEEFLKEFESLEKRNALLELKNKGVRFVAEVPKIELES